MKRRKFIQTLLGLSSLSFVTARAEYWNVDWSIERPNDFPIEEAVFEITQGKQVLESKKIVLLVPEIAENGAVVPVEVTIESPMTEEEYVESIYILTKEGNSRVVYVHLTPANAKAFFATRIKMKDTGDVIAIAKLSDGTFLGTSEQVKVTIGGGCC